jgi:hypothetical protein
MIGVPVWTVKLGTQFYLIYFLLKKILNTQAMPHRKNCTQCKHAQTDFFDIIFGITVGISF